MTGPKLYAAPAARPGTATTRLHMDITDATNLMVWSGSPDEVSAHWDIFSAESAEELRRFLRAEHELAENTDPIHSQSYYLTDDMIARLVSEGNVRHWRVQQRVGDVVLIPAGCAHQVSRIVLYSPQVL